MMNDRINTRIDHKLKQAAVNVFNKIGVSEAEAIRMFYAQVDLHQGIPFELKIPNKKTLLAFEESKNLENLTTYSSSQELFDDLDI